MKSRLSTALRIGLLVVCAAPQIHAQTQTGQSGSQAGMPPLPKPGPEHAIFNEDAGTWDAVVELFMTPGGPPSTSKGQETNTVGCGGLCLITDFKGTMMPGSTFHGHGTVSWDPGKKKYVGSWTDSMTQGMGITEGTWDPAKKTVTGYMEAPAVDGKVVKVRTVTEYKAPGSRVFTMYDAGPDGKEKVWMRITYTRR